MNSFWEWLWLLAQMAVWLAAAWCFVDAWHAGKWGWVALIGFALAVQGFATMNWVVSL